MKEPRCPECQGNHFAYNLLEECVPGIGDRVYIIYCTECGCIVGTGVGGG